MIKKIHNIGYIYNDIKPENICVGNFLQLGTDHWLKMIDFGLVT